MEAQKTNLYINKTKLQNTENCHKIWTSKYVKHGDSDPNLASNQTERNPEKLYKPLIQKDYLAIHQKQPKKEKQTKQKEDYLVRVGVSWNTAESSRVEDFISYWTKREAETVDSSCSRRKIKRLKKVGSEKAEKKEKWKTWKAGWWLQGFCFGIRLFFFPFTNSKKKFQTTPNEESHSSHSQRWAFNGHQTQIGRDSVCVSEREGERELVRITFF